MIADEIRSDDGGDGKYDDAGSDVDKGTIAVVRVAVGNTIQVMVVEVRVGRC